MGYLLTLVTAQFQAYNLVFITYRFIYLSIYRSDRVSTWFTDCHSTIGDFQMTFQTRNVRWWSLLK